MPESCGQGGDLLNMLLNSDTAPANEKPSHANCRLSVWKRSLKLICIISWINLPFISRENGQSCSAVVTFDSDEQWLLSDHKFSAKFSFSCLAMCTCMSRCTLTSVKACTRYIPLSCLGL